ncbi:hypothetical protein RJT34_32052 [Clitoria ternatea]|uniref:Uncharacterized protein n=1 Tax=Clitoria ternatea TaxID=43366 RepID=A0AAN9I1X2_CLITE
MEQLVYLSPWHDLQVVVTPEKKVHDGLKKEKDVVEIFIPLSNHHTWFCGFANLFCKHSKGRDLHAEPLNDASHDPDFVRKVLRRPAKEDCRHEAAQKMLTSILQQQPSLTKLLLFLFSLLFSLSNAYPHFTIGCGVIIKIIKFICLIKSHTLKS